MPLKQHGQCYHHAHTHPLCNVIYTTTFLVLHVMSVKAHNGLAQGQWSPFLDSSNQVCTGHKASPRQKNKTKENYMTSKRTFKEEIIFIVLGSHLDSAVKGRRRESQLGASCTLSATHVTLNESDASESITWPHFKLLNAHFSVHYLDNAHFSKTNGCFR